MEVYFDFCIYKVYYLFKLYMIHFLHLVFYSIDLCYKNIV